MTAQRFMFSVENIDDFHNFLLENKLNTDKVVAHLLYALGFRPRLCGVGYLREVIKYCCELPIGAKINFKRNVFPAVAKIYNTSAACVERDIRHAIHASYNSGDLFALNSLLHYEVISAQYPTTISEFVVSIKDWLRMDVFA